jgi:hypothetical protein
LTWPGTLWTALEMQGPEVGAVRLVLAKIGMQVHDSHSRRRVVRPPRRYDQSLDAIRCGGD